MADRLVDVIRYDAAGAHDTERMAPREAARLLGDGVVWLNVAKPSPELLAELQDAFKLHPLAIEDTHHIPQRAKVEDYEDHLFAVVHMPGPDGGLPDGRVLEQVSLFLGRNHVITIQETEGDVFDNVRDRIRHGRGRIRTMGADYLAYALLDAVVDDYFPLLERLGERLYDLEQEATDNPRPATLAKVRRIKGELLGLRRVAWPQRDALAWFERGDHPLLTRETRVFFRDVHDHMTRILDGIEIQRELASDVDSLYLGTVNTRINDVMRLLTVVATIFIPLSFIAGIYGMNFDPEASPYNMPELAWRYGYPAALAFMVIVGFGIFFAVRRRGWLR